MGAETKTEHPKRTLNPDERLPYTIAETLEVTGMSDRPVSGAARSPGPPGQRFRLSQVRTGRGRSEVAGLSRPSSVCLAFDDPATRISCAHWFPLPSYGATNRNPRSVRHKAKLVRGGAGRARGYRPRFLPSRFAARYGAISNRPSTTPPLDDLPLVSGDQTQWLLSDFVCQSGRRNLRIGLGCATVPTA